MKTISNDSTPTTNGQPLRRWRRRLLSVTIAATSIVSAAIVTTPTAQASPHSDELLEFVESLPGLHLAKITSHDGVQIEAIAAVPSGDGPHPIVVMPSSWSSVKLQYAITAARWAAEGFLVVSYTARGWGFGSDTGLIDVAGPDTIKDVTAVIDWAVANHGGDPERVGAAGVSYGAGIGLLAAGSEDESRIDAVVALSTWGDLTDALYPNETLNTSAIDALLGTAIDGFIGRPGPLLQTIAAEYEEGEIGTGLAIADSRSPLSSVDTLNDRRVAVMIGNAWSDSIFAPSGAVELFEALTGPKKLALAPGDHGGPELGAIGIPTERLDEALDWFQHHVAGVPTDTGPTVELITNDFDRHRMSGDSLGDLTGHEQTYFLTKPKSDRFFWWTGPKHGELQSRASTDWSTSINGGRSTTADSQHPIIPALASGYLHGILRIAPTVIPATINRSNGVVWETGRLWNSPTITGAPELSVTVRPDDDTTTFFVYLYEKNLAEVATLITHKAFTLRDAAPGSDVDLTFELEPTAWEIEPGSRLYMVIDTVDPRYASETSGGNVRFVSPNGNAARLTVPFG